MKKCTFVTSSLLATFAVAPLAAQDWTSSLETGLFSTSRTSTDSDIVDSPYVGAFLAGQAQRNFGSNRLSFDARFEAMDDKGIDDAYETGPLHSGIVGVHFGGNLPNAYVGVFGAVGYFDGAVSDAPMTGQLFGIEGSYDLSSGTQIYAQLGTMSAIGIPGDNEYEGYVARVGTKHDFSDRFSAGLNVEFGRSADCFVDCGDQPGEFKMATLDATYGLNDRVDIVGSVSYLDVYDEDDEDTGTETNIYLGARWNFGSHSESDALSTPMGGFRAAGWMEPLD